jgi:hypothetical protein
VPIAALRPFEEAAITKRNWDRVRRESLLRKQSVSEVDREIGARKPRRSSNSRLTGVPAAVIPRRRKKSRAPSRLRPPDQLINFLQDYVRDSSAELIVDLDGSLATLRTLKSSSSQSFGPIPLTAPDQLTGKFPIGSDGSIRCLLALLRQIPSTAWWPVALDARPIEATSDVLVLRFLTQASTSNSHRVAPILGLIVPTGAEVLISPSTD